MFQDTPSMECHLHVMERTYSLSFLPGFWFGLVLGFFVLVFFWVKNMPGYVPHDSPRNQSHVLSSLGTHSSHVYRFLQYSRNSPYLLTSLKLHLGLWQDASIRTFKACDACVHAIPCTRAHRHWEEVTEQSSTKTEGSQILVLSFSLEAAMCTLCSSDRSLKR